MCVTASIFCFEANVAHCSRGNKHLKICEHDSVIINYDREIVYNIESIFKSRFYGN